METRVLTRVEGVNDRRVLVNFFGRMASKVCVATTGNAYGAAREDGTREWAIQVRIDSIPGIVCLRLADGYEVDFTGREYGWHLDRVDRLAILDEIKRVEEQG